MGSEQDNKYLFSRRTFLKGMQWTPLVFSPSACCGLQSSFSALRASQNPNYLPLADFRLSLHYPANSPLEELFRYTLPGSDEYVTEKHADEIGRLLDGWSQALKISPPALGTLAKFIDLSIAGVPLGRAQTVPLRSGNGINVSQRQFAHET